MTYLVVDGEKIFSLNHMSRFYINPIDEEGWRITLGIIEGGDGEMPYYIFEGTYRECRNALRYLCHELESGKSMIGLCSSAPEEAPDD